MRILLTGARGFLGKYISRALIGNEIISLSRSDADITSDLSREVPELPLCEIVIHSAGKAHASPKTEGEKSEFFNVNVIGTQNLLTALEQSNSIPKSFVYISSVAVYGLVEGHLVNEDAPLNAQDPYGRSKIVAEQIIKEWCTNRSVKCLILRLPLIAGLNPPGNLGSMIKGIKAGYYFNIANGSAKKSVVLASNVASLIPNALETDGTFNLTDGYHPSFLELSNLIAKQLNKTCPRSLPIWGAQLLAKLGNIISGLPINDLTLRKITSTLVFDDSKARMELGWTPDDVLTNLKIK